MRCPKLWVSSPTVSTTIVEFLEKNWQDLVQDVHYKDHIIRPGTDGADCCEKFEWSEERVSDFDKWIALRDSWRKTEIPARQAAKVFESFVLSSTAAYREKGNRLSSLWLTVS